MLLEARLDRGFNLVDRADGFLNLGPGVAVQQGDPRAGACGIARRGDLVERHVWDHAQDHCVFGRDMRAKGARQHHAVYGFDVKFVHQ